MPSRNSLGQVSAQRRVCIFFTLYNLIATSNCNLATCQTPGCREPVYVDKVGQRSNYCSISHKTFAQLLPLIFIVELFKLASKKRYASCALLLLCFWSRIFVLDDAKIMQKKEGPWFWKFLWVIKPSRAVCFDVSLFWHRLSASLLVAHQFKQSWRHTEAVCPPVCLVYKIIFPASKLVKYNAYRWVIDPMLP